MRNVGFITPLNNFIQLNLDEKVGVLKFYKGWLKCRVKIKKFIEGKISPPTQMNEPELSKHVNFFVTAQYGFYPSIFYFIHKRYPEHKIVCLIGKGNQKALLKKLTEKYRAKIEFVEIGSSLFSIRNLFISTGDNKVFVAFLDGHSKGRDQTLAVER